MTEPRLMIDADLATGVEIALDEAQARHVGQVLRRDTGDAVRVFNAHDGEWRALVAAKTKRGMSVRVAEKLREARVVPDLDLLFAPVKRHATDLIVEKATELGVRRIRPVITQRTIAETVRVDRLASIAREAAEQTERFDAPEIFEPVSLARVVDGWDAGRALIYADEGGDAGAMSEALSSSPPQAIALLTGPEGGFTDEERRMLRSLAFVRPVSLGPRILRAETAVIAALSVIQSIWGDWRKT